MSERKYWLLALGWMGVIDSTLYIARPAAEFLRERNLLRLTVWSLVALLGVAVLAWALRRRPGPRAWGALALGAIVFLLAVSTVAPAEVKLHFVEYGLLGALFHLALRARGVRLAWIWAIVLCGMAGAVDEGIQYFLPNRWYDTQDIVINVVAGAIAVLTMALYARLEAVDRSVETAEGDS